MLTDDVIRFYRATGNFGFLSNLFKREIVFEGKTFPTNEHAYQYGKPKDIEVAEWIMKAPKPHLVALISHSLFFYDMKPEWNKIKVERMKAILRAKFTQHEDLKERLLQTGSKILIENSKMDAFWGIGKNGKGKNILGKLLMEIRSEFLSNSVE